MKHETGDVANNKFAAIKPKMYSFLIDGSAHKTAKGVNENIVTTISHNEYKEVRWNKKCWRLGWIGSKVKII